MLKISKYTINKFFSIKHSISITIKTNISITSFIEELFFIQTKSMKIDQTRMMIRKKFRCPNEVRKNQAKAVKISSNQDNLM